MTDEPQNHTFRVATLPARKPQRFRLTPSAKDRATLAKELDITAIAALTFEGEIRAEGREDYRLDGRLKGTVEQPCVVTLAPVVTKIDTPVRRRYSASYVAPTGEEAEMPEDDTLEPIPEVIDLRDIAAEELALALPDWPRAPGAELGEAVFAAPEAAPLRDADLRPFAGLQALKDKLEKDG